MYLKGLRQGQMGGPFQFWKGWVFYLDPPETWYSPPVWGRLANATTTGSTV